MSFEKLKVYQAAELLDTIILDLTAGRLLNSYKDIINELQARLR